MLRKAGWEINVMNKELLFFEPVFKTLVWGGNRMRDVYGYDIPSENTGECWAISAHPNGDCVCISQPFKGMTLSKIWNTYPEVFGNFGGDRFPLLLKVIDAASDLSIQVHPDDHYARLHENGSLGKTECWYILECDENAKLVIGHNARSREELISMIDEGRFCELIREVPIKKGDFIQIDPGTVHAIKGGVMLLETQENSDVTYRLYDYDRLFEGKKRELHLAQSKEVITIPAKENAVVSTSSDRPFEVLIECDHYRVLKINVKERATLEDNASLRLVSCVEGEGSVNGIPLKKGQHFIVPKDYGELLFRGRMTLISSVPVAQR